MTVFEAIEGLCHYGIESGFIEKDDLIYCRNQLLELMSLKRFEESAVQTTNHFECLKVLVEDAAARGLIESSMPPYSDLFESRLMNVFIPKPSAVNRAFKACYDESPEKATAYFYELSKKSHYIRLDRTSKNVKWTVDSKYGEIDITVNLSKPEKDPKAIAAVLDKVETDYPKCLLCLENEGYSGHVNHPGRQNHRIIPLELEHESWYFQYSPYAYFNEHSIVLKATHDLMEITPRTFKRLMDFIDIMPHYFIGSNADLPLVGGSLLTHDHYQAGSYEFPMAKAEVSESYDIDGVQVGRVKWPLTVLRIYHEDREKVIETATKIFQSWIQYDDPSCDILSKTEVRHNTVTPIARKKGRGYELDLVLRNNRCDDVMPTGIFHPHPRVHPVKKENIGLIEVMGLAVLPSRLIKEMDEIVKALINGDEFTGDLKKFENLFKDIQSMDTEEETMALVKTIVGDTFVQGLEDAGVYKNDDAGNEGLKRFIDVVK